MSVEEILEQLQKSRARPKNLSHFAFTATPKHSTLMLFGRTPDGGRASKTNLPQPFHRYPMRQAIEEEFILDVLQGYTPYQTAFNLAKQVEDKKRVGSSAAKKGAGAMDEPAPDQRHAEGAVHHRALQPQRRPPARRQGQGNGRDQLSRGSGALQDRLRCVPGQAPRARAHPLHWWRSPAS
jgi:hypothetical protein